MQGTQNYDPDYIKYGFVQRASMVYAIHIFKGHLEINHFIHKDKPVQVLKKPNRIWSHFKKLSKLHLLFRTKHFIHRTNSLSALQNEKNVKESSGFPFICTSYILALFWLGIVKSLFQPFLFSHFTLLCLCVQYLYPYAFI